MKKKRIFSRAGSEQQYEPHTIGEIIDQMLQSNSPFSRAYLEHLEHAFPNTEPGIDLKLITREPGRMEIGEMKSGMITRDGDDHYLFVENAGRKETGKTIKRKPPVFCGSCINVRLWDDGSLHVSLKRPRFNTTQSFCKFCLDAADELYMVGEAFEREE